MIRNSLSRALLCMISLCAAVPVLAGGCITARSMGNLNCAMDNLHNDNAGHFEFTLGYRDIYSDRHFRGTHEERNRQEEGSDVRNSVQTYDFGLTYWKTNSWRFSMSVPFVMANRSSLYEHDRVNRHKMEADGVGDLRLMGFYDKVFTDGVRARGLTLGLGVKLPTGRDDVRDIAYRTTGPEERFVDQSIQPGDGGVGYYTDLAAFSQVGNERNLVYFSGSYLFNPKETNGVSNSATPDVTTEYSTNDAYQLRAGWTFIMIPKHGLSLDLGVRNEGVPARDAIGGDEGFRRPGYAVYLEAGLSMSLGQSRFSLSVPYAVRRNRTLSVNDMRTGRHGDAAFADYLVLGNYSYRF